MTVETATYPSQLNTAWPQASDMVSEGDNHIRLTKTVIKTTFPNVAGVVSATDIQLSYVTGVTSAIQAQIDSKGAIAGQTWTGAHIFSGSAAVPTLAQGTSTTGAASTAFVQAEWATRLPNYTGPITSSSAELNRLVGVTSGVQAQIDAKGAIAGQTWTGAHDYTAGTLRAATLAAGTSTTEVATTAHVASVAFSAVLPGQLGNAGKLLTTDGTNASWSDTIAGNLNFSGTGRRITADFSNATIANRAIFQTSTTNNTTSINAIPNGTGTASRFSTSNASDPDNAGEFSIVANATEARLESNRRGTGAYLPMTTYVGGFKNTEQPVAGGFLVAAPAGMGYGTGAGGAETQLTSKSNAVTLNKPCGLITMNNAALAAGATALFTFSNSLIGTGDVVYLQLDTTGIASTANYNVWAAGGSGAAVVAIKNISAGSLSEAVRLRFVVIKGAQS